MFHKPQRIRVIFVKIGVLKATLDLMGVNAFVSLIYV